MEKIRHIVYFITLLQVTVAQDSSNEEFFSFDNDSIPISRIVNFVYMDKSIYTRHLYNDIYDGFINRKMWGKGSLQINISSHTKSIFSKERLKLTPDIGDFDIDLGFYRTGNILFNMNFYMKSYGYFYNDMDYVDNDDDEGTDASLDTSVTGFFDTGAFSLTFGYVNEYFTPILSVFEVTTDHFYSEYVDLMPDSLQDIYNDRYAEVEEKVFESGLLDKTDINESVPSIAFLGVSPKFGFGVIYSDYLKMVDLHVLKAYTVDRLAMDYSRIEVSPIKLFKKIYKKKSPLLLDAISYDMLFNYIGVSFDNYNDFTSRLLFEKTFYTQGFYLSTSLGSDYDHTHSVFMKKHIELRPGIVGLWGNDRVIEMGLTIGFYNYNLDYFVLDSDNLYPDRLYVSADINVYLIDKNGD
tara:strand:+ start:65 stop:1294 length:1230 start_codon:yes stop_codon:yes gene_type:complete